MKMPGLPAQQDAIRRKIEFKTETATTEDLEIAASLDVATRIVGFYENLRRWGFGGAGRP